jgi:hypothetical protein
VEGEFYYKESMALDFWYLIYRGWYDYAKHMYDRNLHLRDLISDMPFYDKSSSKKCLVVDQFIE